MRSFLFALMGAAAVDAYTVVAMKSFMYKNIDPVVLPGTYKSHMHTFMGSDKVTKDTSTSAELREGCTTAENPNDLSVYWVPTLYYTGGSEYQPIAPMRFSAYYENIGDAEMAIPENYMLVVGNSSGTTQADVDATASGAQWFCEGDDAPADKEAAAFPTTTCSTHLQHLLYFHDCINPDDVTEHSYSGRANAANANRCPTGHKRIPQLRFSIRYDLRKVISAGWSGQPPLALASGNSFSAHGDFINGWDTDALENMLLASEKREYAYVNGSRSAASCTPTDADPGNGTSDYETSLTMMPSNLRRAIVKAFRA
ncbi:hypothetical protein GQ53DRAFT_832724 [Thozetella sp. PMI_491]|nr:hypothetical protein GQ53DRAFT_832724 [Thozetella sp. PMI_491]